MYEGNTSNSRIYFMKVDVEHVSSHAVPLGTILSLTAKPLWCQAHDVLADQMTYSHELISPIHLSSPELTYHSSEHSLTCRSFICFLCRCGPTQAMASSFLRFLDYTQRRMIPLDARSVRRRDFYLTTHNTHNRQTSIPPVGFEPTISVGERPWIYTLDGAATGTGHLLFTSLPNS